MKNLRCFLRGGQFLTVFLAILACATTTFAQTTYVVPVVTVQATQPIATATNSGVFTVFRAGDTNAQLNVWYDLDGTASNGVDYAPIPPHIVTIPAGATSSAILVTPTSNVPPNAVKTVVLTLTNSPLLTPVNYEIGSPSSATIYLAGSGVTNVPPDVYIFDPTNGEVFYTPTNIQILAKASDPDGSVTDVEFFAGTNDLGSGAMAVLEPPGDNGVTGPVWFFSWRNVPVGDYALTAVATDNGGASTTSAPVSIAVLQGPPPTNAPPAIRIDSPTNGEAFFASVVCPSCVTNNPPCELPCYFEGPDIPIYATASASSGTASVEFFADGQDLGPGELEGCITPAGNCVGCPPPVLTCTYSLVWSNAPVGNHVLTAIATDNNGLSSTSAPVAVSVIQSLPPNPVVVRIISPPNGAVFRAPINLPLFAYAYTGFEEVSVGFYDGTNFLGLGQPVSTPTPVPLTPGDPTPVPLTALSTNIYSLIWSNAPVGNHVLTAEAVGYNTNNAIVLRIVSAPVNITILAPLPPPTNRPPIVSIVATDPVAVEGTNSWVWRGETNSPPTWAAWPTAVCHFFTNCGPKTATFTVRRCGDTNNDLTVPYDIGGTASNGVDYVALPGSVTIPAGERRALITIVPIDDGPPDVNKTVILTLLPDMQANPLPGYVLGFPYRAAAIILDPGPRPVSGMLPGHYFHLKETGPDAAWFCIEYSTNLVNWTPVCTNQVIDGSIDFVDPDASNNSSRFYRAVPVTNPPSD